MTLSTDYPRRAGRPLGVDLRTIRDAAGWGRSRSVIAREDVPTVRSSRASVSDVSDGLIEGGPCCLDGWR